MTHLGSRPISSYRSSHSTSGPLSEISQSVTYGTNSMIYCQVLCRGVAILHLVHYDRVRGNSSPQTIEKGTVHWEQAASSGKKWPGLHQVLQQGKACSASVILKQNTIVNNYGL